MEIETVRQQLEDLLYVFESENASMNDIILGTMSYVESAHLAAQCLLLEGRFPEAQRCIDLCRSVFIEEVFPGLYNGCSKAESYSLAKIPITGEAAPASSLNRSDEGRNILSQNAALFTTKSNSVVAAERHRDQGALGIKRASSPLPSITISEVDLELLTALQDRTAQLQRQCDCAKDLIPGRNTSYYMKKLKSGETKRQLRAVRGGKGCRPAPPERHVSPGFRVQQMENRRRQIHPFVTNSEHYFCPLPEPSEEIKEDDFGAANVAKLYIALRGKSKLIDPDWYPEKEENEDGLAMESSFETPLYLREVNSSIFLSPNGLAANSVTPVMAYSGAFASGGVRPKQIDRSPAFREGAPLFVPPPRIQEAEFKKHILGYKRRSLTESYTAMRVHRSPSTGLIPYRIQSSENLQNLYGSQKSTPSWWSAPDLRGKSYISPIYFSYESTNVDGEGSEAEEVCSGDMVDADEKIYSNRSESSSSSLNQTDSIGEQEMQSITRRSLRIISATETAISMADRRLKKVFLDNDLVFQRYLNQQQLKPLALQDGIDILPFLCPSLKPVTSKPDPIALPAAVPESKKPHTSPLGITAHVLASPLTEEPNTSKSANNAPESTEAQLHVYQADNRAPLSLLFAASSQDRGSLVNSVGDLLRCCSSTLRPLRGSAPSLGTEGSETRPSINALHGGIEVVRGKELGKRSFMRGKRRQPLISLPCETIKEDVAYIASGSPHSTQADSVALPPGPLPPLEGSSASSPLSEQCTLPVEYGEEVSELVARRLDEMNGIHKDHPPVHPKAVDFFSPVDDCTHICSPIYREEKPKHFIGSGDPSRLVGYTEHLTSNSTAESSLAKAKLEHDGSAEGYDPRIDTDLQQQLIKSHCSRPSVARVYYAVSIIRLQRWWRSMLAQRYRKQRAQKVSERIRREEAALIIQDAARLFFQRRRITQQQLEEQLKRAAELAENHGKVALESPSLTRGFSLSSHALYSTPSEFRGTCKSMVLRRLQQAVAARRICRAYRRYRVVFKHVLEAKAYLLFVTGKCSEEYMLQLASLDDL